MRAVLSTVGSPGEVEPMVARNERWGAALNAQRDALGPPPVTDVRGHLFTDRPWLAADPFLAPWPAPSDGSVLQVGAWMRQDRRALPEVAALTRALRAALRPDVVRRAADAARSIRTDGAVDGCETARRGSGCRRPAAGLGAQAELTRSARSMP